MTGTPDLQSIFSNPLFTNGSGSYSAQADFLLNYLSPSIDAGTTTSIMNSSSTDFFGNPIYGTPDMGAIEYQPPHNLALTTPDTIDIGWRCAYLR